MENNSNKMGKLKIAIDRSSAINRNIGIFFSSFLFYVLASTSGTTDLQLLLPDSNLSLPILNLELPLFSFYFATPIIVLFLHFYVLLNLEMHVHKLFLWLNMLDENEKSNSIQLITTPFMFDFRHFYSRRSFNSVLVKAITYFFTFLLPLIILIYIQFRFSDYQNLWMTSWHFGSVIIDVIIMMNFKNRILNPVETNDSSFLELNPFIGKRIVRIIQIILKTYSIILKLLRIKANSKLKIFQSAVHNNYKWISNRTRLLPIALYFVATLHWVLMIFVCSESLPNFIEKYADSKILSERLKLVSLVPHISVREQRLTKYSINDENLNLNENLSETCDIEYLQIDRSNSFDLSGRHLRFAEFSGSDMFAIKLQSARLEGANFSHAKLHLADFKDANLEGAIFHKTKMNCTNFRNANLQNSGSSESSIANSDFYKANLNNSGFKFSDLRGSNFQGVQFVGSHLVGSDLQGANFAYANMEGANLFRANTQGANFQDANMNYTNLENTNMQGASFSQTDLEYANFEMTKLQGASMKNVKLKGSFWYDVSILGLDSLELFKADSSSFLKINFDSINLDSTLNFYSKKLSGLNQSQFVARMSGAIKRQSLAIPFVIKNNGDQFVQCRVNSICSNEMESIKRSLWTFNESEVKELNQLIINSVNIKCYDKMAGVKFHSSYF